MCQCCCDLDEQLMPGSTVHFLARGFFFFSCSSPSEPTSATFLFDLVFVAVESVGADAALLSLFFLAFPTLAAFGSVPNDFRRASFASTVVIVLDEGWSSGFFEGLAAPELLYGDFIASGIGTTSPKVMLCGRDDRSRLNLLM